MSRESQIKANQQHKIKFFENLILIPEGLYKYKFHKIITVQELFRKEIGVKEFENQTSKKMNKHFVKLHGRNYI